MPYIPPGVRKILENTRSIPTNGGQLNYTVACTVDQYIGLLGLSYDTITDVRGALIGACQEFDRKIAWPYENLKCRQNGEVFNRSIHAFAVALDRHPGPVDPTPGGAG